MFCPKTRRIHVVRNDPYPLSRNIYGLVSLPADKIAQELRLFHHSPSGTGGRRLYAQPDGQRGPHLRSPRQWVHESTPILDVGMYLGAEGIGELAIRQQVRTAPIGTALSISLLWMNDT